MHRGSIGKKVMPSRGLNWDPTSALDCPMLKPLSYRDSFIKCLKYVDNCNATLGLLKHNSRKKYCLVRDSNQRHPDLLLPSHSFNHWAMETVPSESLTYVMY